MSVARPSALKVEDLGELPLLTIAGVPEEDGGGYLLYVLFQGRNAGGKSC